MIDTENLQKDLASAASRFADDVLRLWEETATQPTVDLRADPHPWWAPVRAANTNGSILLDRYAHLLTPEGVDCLGLEVAVSLFIVGVVTEASDLFVPPR